MCSGSQDRGQDTKCRQRQPDQDRRPDHGARDRAARLPALLAKRRGRLEADERQQAEDHPLEGRPDAVGTETLDPQPIALDVKVVLVGEDGVAVAATQATPLQIAVAGP